MGDAPSIERIAQELVDLASAERPSTVHPARRVLADLRGQSHAVGRLLGVRCSTDRGVPTTQRPAGRPIGSRHGPETSLAHLSHSKVSFDEEVECKKPNSDRLKKIFRLPDAMRTPYDPLPGRHSWVRQGGSLAGVSSIVASNM